MKTREEQLTEALDSYRADNPEEDIEVEDFAGGFCAAFNLGFEARLDPSVVNIDGADSDYAVMMDLVHLTAAEVYDGLPELDHNTRLAIAIGKGVEAALAARFRRLDTTVEHAVRSREGYLIESPFPYGYGDVFTLDNSALVAELIEGSTPVTREITEYVPA